MIRLKTILYAQELFYKIFEGYGKTKNTRYQLLEIKRVINEILYDMEYKVLYLTDK